MQIAHDVKLLRLIKVIPPIIVTAFALLTIFIVINHNENQLVNDIKTLRQDFYDAEKDIVKAQIKQLIQQINYEESSTEALLKNNIKEHIYQAHAIATSIYNKNKTKPEKEVTQLITDALRKIRFNQGRGYFFIYKTNGLNIMHPVVPTMEGKAKLDLQDVRGNYIVRDLGQLAKRKGEAFYHWWFVKPDNVRQEFEKIGFGKHFAPYDWFIGTGEYLIDVENDIKKRLIQRISNIRYKTNGYMFLLDYSGNVLSHITDDFKNNNIGNNKDPSDVELRKQIIEIAKQGSGYLNYQSPVMPSTGKPAQKISYIEGFPQWEWVIGSGFYLSETEKYLQRREQTIALQNEAQLRNLLWLSLFVTLFFVSLSLFLTKYLAKRFTLYENKISDDFDELNKVKLQTQYQALHDSLTTLPNRSLLEEHISQGIALSKTHDKSLAVMFVDLDDFKKINDLHGHSVGDQLLVALGKSFKKILANQDSVARFGGDEFVFCFPNIDDMHTAKDKVETIQKIFKQEFVLKGKAIYSSCSIGIAMYPNDGDVAEDLISKADIVLYKSKSLQKGNSLFFNESINKEVKRSFLIESELRLALAENELDVLYQPQISVQSGEIQGVEALVRWNNKILGPVSPAEFIQVAEDIGVIDSIGSFVIEKSLRDIKHFNLNNAYSLILSINISPKQLMEPNFVEHIMSIIRDVDYDPCKVILEITENVFISDLTKVRPVLECLRKHGFRISLDDFGTGYSSLSYLSNLPMSEIKIDRSFIDKFLVNTQSESLVKTIIAIGKFCNLAVVAEGVETKAQYDRLVLFNCDLIQGYYFDRPLSLAELVEKYQLTNIDGYNELSETLIF
jgi:diguanylate cyclase (GGDEF)-like protein